jgi:NAD(P)-dependent dehydrogenase (short-subunit alcohol dehydrogenase family)
LISPASFSTLLHRFIKRGHAFMATSWALISGASTGIGRATALKLAAQGWQVLAGVRSQAASEALAATPGVIPIQLEVTDQASITAAAAKADELTGPNGLRLVMNNAGVVVAGPVEFVTAEEWRRQFDVNFFSMVELTRATLPLLRRAAVAQGAFVPRLLFISSIAGRVHEPILGPYSTSKFATTSLGDSLRLELRRQGIGVTVVEPGAVATEIWAKGDTYAAQFDSNHPSRKLYGPEIDGIIAASKKISSKAISSEKAADDIVASILARQPQARLLIGPDAKVTAFLRRWLPLSWFDAVLRREFGIAGLPVKPQA